MMDFGEIIEDLQNDGDFCDFTEEELIELVNYITNDNEGDNHVLFNKSGGNTR